MADDNEGVQETFWAPKENETLYALVDMSDLKGTSFLKRATLRQILLWGKIYAMEGKPTKRLDLISDVEPLQYLYWNLTSEKPPDDLETLEARCSELATRQPINETPYEELRSRVPEDMLKSASQKRKDEEIQMGKEPLKKPGEKGETKVKKEKKEKVAKAPKEPKDHSTSNKAKVFAAFIGGETDIAALGKVVKGAVKEGTIKSWIGSWYRGDNLPAIATEEQKASLVKQGEKVTKQREAERAEKAAKVEKKAEKIKKAAKVEPEAETEAEGDDDSDDDSDDSE